MKKKLMTIILAAALSVSMLCACGGDDSAADAAPADAAVEDTGAEEADAEEADAEGADAEEAGDAVDVTYVDGFYANDGEKDFMIFFYETSNGDLAYVNDGTDEAIAEYTVTEDALDDGTPFYLVSVGETTLGYYEEGEDVYLVDDEGSVYNAAHLTEEEAEDLHSMVTE